MIDSRFSRFLSFCCAFRANPHGEKFQFASRKLSVFLILSAILCSQIPAPALEGNSIPPSALPELYKPLFRDPYEFMFQTLKNTPPLSIDGKTMGMYMGGIRGFLFYWSFSDCASQYIKEGKKSDQFDDLSSIERMSGIKIFLKEAKDLNDFSHLNPDIIIWGRKNLIPKPSDKVLGVKFNELYQKVFKRFFRLMVESYHFLNGQGITADEGKKYLESMKEQGFDALDYLEKRFQGDLSDYKVEKDGTVLTPPMAIGFWIRRNVDTTSPVLWEALSDLMNLYDKEWFTSIGEHYKPR